MASVLRPPCGQCMQQGVTNAEYVFTDGVRRACQLQGVQGQVLCQEARCRRCWAVHHLPFVDGNNQYVQINPQAMTVGGGLGPSYRLTSEPTQVPLPPHGRSAASDLARKLGLGGSI